MDKQERKTELQIIASHLASVISDLERYRVRLEEADCRREARLLGTEIGHLGNIQWIVGDKGNR